LPHFAIQEAVRVCDSCYNTLQQEQAIANNNQQQLLQQQNLSSASPSHLAATATPSTSASCSTVATSPRPVLASFSGFGRSSPAATYDLAGDLDQQLRQAVKNGDEKGVKSLLDAGADFNYIDHTKNSVLHLAAILDRFEIAKLLLERGANAQQLNAQNESPLDLAPPFLKSRLQPLVSKSS